MNIKHEALIDAKIASISFIAFVIMLHLVY